MWIRRDSNVANAAKVPAQAKFPHNKYRMFSTLKLAERGSDW